MIQDYLIGQRVQLVGTQIIRTIATIDYNFEQSGIAYGLRMTEPDIAEGLDAVMFVKPSLIRVPDNDKLTLDDLLLLKGNTREPLTYCLIGSTSKAYKQFESETLRLTLEGHIVLSIGANVSDDDLHITDEQKSKLDILHLCKIDKADVVLVLNVDNYIGSSTSRELEYAKRLLNDRMLKRIEYLESTLSRDDA